MKRDDCVEALILHADRYKLTPTSIFAFCAATVTAGGENWKDVSLSLSTIRRLKLKAEVETADAIKRNFDFPPHAEVHFDEKDESSVGNGTIF